MQDFLDLIYWLDHLPTSVSNKKLYKRTQPHSQVKRIQKSQNTSSVRLHLKTMRTISIPQHIIPILILIPVMTPILQAGPARFYSSAINLGRRIAFSKTKIFLSYHLPKLLIEYSRIISP